MAGGVRKAAKPVPSRDTVGSDLPPVSRLLEYREYHFEACVQLVCADVPKLLLGIVQIVEVDRSQSEVLTALRETIANEARREAMPAGHDLIGLHDLRIEELALNVRLVFLARR